MHSTLGWILGVPALGLCHHDIYTAMGQLPGGTLLGGQRCVAKRSGQGAAKEGGKEIKEIEEETVGKLRVSLLNSEHC